MTHVLQEQTCEDESFMRRDSQKILSCLVYQKQRLFKGRPSQNKPDLKYEVEKLGWFLLITAELLQSQPEESVQFRKPYCSSFLAKGRKGSLKSMKTCNDYSKAKKVC